MEQEVQRRCVAMLNHLLLGQRNTDDRPGQSSQIVATREQWVTEPGDLEEIIAIAVAQGIALGRKEGLAIAGELLGKTRD